MEVAERTHQGPSVLQQTLAEPQEVVARLEGVQAIDNQIQVVTPDSR